jgi:uncharacterized protein (DUF1810 family)
MLRDFSMNDGIEFGAGVVVANDGIESLAPPGNYISICTMSDSSSDPFNLTRFVKAQEGSYAAAIAELRAGEKQSHWMWFIFPQVAGLGNSSMAQRYAIQSRAEAVAYLAHPILGPRLRECAEALRSVDGRSAEQIMGYPDDIKLKSSLTLFGEVSPPGSIFECLLEKYYEGSRDSKTLDFLRREP